MIQSLWPQEYKENSLSERQTFYLTLRKILMSIIIKKQYVTNSVVTILNCFAIN